MKRIIILVLALSIFASGCANGDVSCDCCGSRIMSDKARVIEDEWFCSDCYFSASTCMGCKKYYSNDTDAPYLNYCYSCINEMNVCEMCGVPTLEEYVVETPDTILCAACVIGDFEYSYCNICYEGSIALSNFAHSNEEYNICNKCVTKYFRDIETMKPCYYCIGCGSLTDNMNYIHSWTNEVLCANCVTEYEECKSCGKYDTDIRNGICGICGEF